MSEWVGGRVGGWFGWVGGPSSLDRHYPIIGGPSRLAGYTCKDSEQSSNGEGYCTLLQRCLNGGPTSDMVAHH